MIAPALNMDRVEAFGQKMAMTLNHAALALMTSIGHRTGLFDRMANLRATTSADIAQAAGLNERYVREWLAAMVTGGVVEYDPTDLTYRLPAEHAACLTRAASPSNVAVGAQFISILGAVEDQVVAAFHHGKGVPYSAYPRFDEVMAEESNQSVVAGLRNHIIPLVPGLEERLVAGIDVLDVGCGRGQAMIHLAEQFPRSHFVGYDFSLEAIREANACAERRGLQNVFFKDVDAAEMPENVHFDLITAFDSIHDQARPAEVLANIARALRPDGVFLMQDISGSGHVHRDCQHPVGTFLYTISCMHCMSVSLAYGGPGLGAMWGKEKALKMLAEAGFATVEVKELPYDAMNFWYIARKG